MTLANDLSVQETRRVGKDILICGKKYMCLYTSFHVATERGSVYLPPKYMANYKLMWIINL